MAETHEETVARVIGANVADAMERGPGLRYSTGQVVLAKDEKKRQVLVGGFGPFGAGRMWCDNANGIYDAAPGFDTCPSIDRPPPPPTTPLTVREVVAMLSQVDQDAIVVNSLFGNVTGIQEGKNRSGTPLVRLRSDTRPA